MKHSKLKYGWLLIVLFLWTGCARKSFQPLSYDPEGSTITTDKEIQFQQKKTFAFPESGVWVSNEFDGARLNDFQKVNDTTYVALILPENHPINNSAWYAFKIWASHRKRIRITLTYRYGTHRYIPKISRDGLRWAPVDSMFFTRDTSAGTAELKLTISPDTLWVSAQELIASARFEAFMRRLAEKPYVTMNQIGLSKFGRPLYLLRISETDASKGHIFIISRQHPPEVTGTLALFTFLETLSEESQLARRFRSRFAVLAIPLMNPDGVDLGHWRHNGGGVDLNRDWFQFNQPETRQAKEIFEQAARTARPYFCLDFHSTQEDVFYTLSKKLKTNPPGLTDRWLEKIQEMNPDYAVNESPSGLGTPVSKNWFYQTFQAPSVTYEVGDEKPREQIRTIARSAAIALMQVVLDALNE